MYHARTQAKQLGVRLGDVCTAINGRLSSTPSAILAPRHAPPCTWTACCSQETQFPVFPSTRYAAIPRWARVLWNCLRVRTCNCVAVDRMEYGHCCHWCAEETNCVDYVPTQWLETRLKTLETFFKIGIDFIGSQHTYTHARAIMSLEVEYKFNVRFLKNYLWI